MVPHRLKWHQKLVATLIYLLMRTLAATWRIRWHDESEGLLKNKERLPVVFCLWHNRLATSMMFNYLYVRKYVPSRQLAAIVSASKDGGIVAHVLELFDSQPVRGSSSRRGAQALLELKTLTERGLDIAITPDGPRGPCYRVQDGALSLAQITGLPIIPAGAFIHWKVRTKSWDRFQIPLPFTRIDAAFGKPISVPRDCSDEDYEKIRLQIEREMNRLSRD